MAWERKLAVVGAIPLVVIPAMLLAAVSFPLALQHGLVTPGWYAIALAEQVLSFTGLSRAFVILPVDAASWIVIIAAIYGLIRRNITILRWLALPLSIVLALECDGFLSPAP